VARLNDHPGENCRAYEDGKPRTMARIFDKGGLKVGLPVLFMLTALVSIALISAVCFSGQDSALDPMPKNETNLSSEELIEGITAGVWIAPYGEYNLSSEMDITLEALPETARTLRIAVGGDDAVSVGYVGASNGVLIVWPDITETLIEIAPFDHRERPWYQEAKSTGETIWTDPYLDTGANAPAITCATPIYSGGEVVGVAGMDVSLVEINRDMSLHPDLYSFLLDEAGVVVMRPLDLPEGFLWDELLMPGSLLDSRSPQLGGVADKMIHEQTGVAMVSLNKGECRIAYAPLPSTGWSLGVVSGDSELAMAKAAQYDEHFRRVATQNDIVALSAAENLRDIAARKPKEAEEVENLSEDVEGGKTGLIFAAFVASLLLAGAIGVWASRDISRSLEQIVEALDSATEGDLEEVEADLPDEIGAVSEAFNRMVAEQRHSKVEEYLTNGQEEVMERIREILLPEKMPLVEGYEVAVISLRAGHGDDHFYDVFEMDDNRTGVVMAKVSGDGVSAALLAVLSKPVIRASFRRGEDPAKALREANLEISESSKQGMLVSCFCGMLDPSSNLMEYANAGYVPPFVVSSQGFVDTLTGGGIALGVLDNIELDMEGWMLDSGDVLVIYNDGTIDAIDELGEKFGTEKLIEVVRDNRARHATEIIETIEKAIKSHIENQPQKDDFNLIIVKKSD